MNSRETLAQLNARLERVESRLGIRLDGSSRRPPFYGLTPVSGLHVLKDGWNQVASMMEQCSWLNKELDAALEATRALAPDRVKRGKNFGLSRRIQQPRPKNGEERQLEWDIYDRWGLKLHSHDGEHPLLKRVLGFQVPVYDNRLHDGWDKIDLVALTHSGDPTICELKKGSSEEKPLRPILEAAGYAVALKKVWKGFRKECQKLLSDKGIDIDLSAEPNVFRLMVLAPSSYWNYLFKCKGITPEHWRHLLELTNSLGQQGFPVSFVDICEGPPTMRLCDAEFPSG